MTLADLLPLLRCPRSRAELVLDGTTLVSSDPATRLQYQILEEIPILIPEEATELSAEDWSALMVRHARNPQTGLPVSPP